MDFETVKDLSSKYLFPNYGRLDLAFERGEGCYLYDAKGKQYLDTVAGIAVCSLGYSHPDWVKAMRDQVSHLVHVSNLYYVEEQAQLAQRLNTVTPDAITRTLFVNSGAEANEGAMKTAVRYTKRHKVLSAYNGFHGRTSAALGATAQKKYQETFEPLINEKTFGYFEYNDLESVKSLIDRDTACLLVEGIQGEGGVVCGTPEFLRGVRDLCTDYGVLMIVDEVQTGVGRTGKWWCMDNYGIVPDIITTAKGLAAGMPIGAIMTTDEIASVMTPGTHGTTFGGNPIAAAGANVVLNELDDAMLAEVNQKGEYLKSAIAAFDSPYVDTVRGMGLMIGIVLKEGVDRSALVKALYDHNLLVLTAGPKTIRLLPPLVISQEEMDTGLAALKDVLVP